MRKIITVLVVVCGLAAVESQAQTGAGLLLDPGPKGKSLELRGEALVFDQGYTKQSDNDFKLSLFGSKGRYRFQPDQPLAPAVGYAALWSEIDTDDPALPDRLVDVSLGAGMAIGQSAPWWFAVSAGVGYAGDSPFGDSDAWYGKADLMIGREWGKGIFLVVLDYDGSRAFMPDVPLPGVAYKSELNPTLSYVAGLPLSAVTWKPTDQFTLDVTYMLPETFDVRAKYNLMKELAVVGSFTNHLNAYHLDGDGPTRRLFFQQRRLEVGVQWEPLEDLGISLACGYAFSQEFTYGFDSRNLKGITDVSDEPYVRLGVEFRP